MAIEKARRVRRFVTGHDATGKAIFLETGEPPQLHARRNVEDTNVELTELWATSAMPAVITAREAVEPNDRPLTIEPPANGTVLRLVDFYPGHVEKMPPRSDGKPGGTHRTETIDYGIVIEGEMHLVLDDDETVVMQQGDVVIQRGTSHSWQNRSSSVARIAFVLVDGTFDPALAGVLGDEHGELSTRNLLKH